MPSSTTPDPAPDTGNEGAGRCPWATGPWLTPYHDHEWGVPVHDDRHHFEHLVLEGAQAGLSWLTILKRRAAYRRAFAGFDPATVAGFGPAEIRGLMNDTGIIRNRRKIEAAVANAVAVCELQERGDTLDRFLWARVDGRPLVNTWHRIEDVPAATPLSEALSRDLRRIGFRFVGPIVCYSHLQSVGIVMDHLTTCFRHAQLVGA